MKITVAKNAGFCFGVKRAIDIARASSKKKEPVYMLGDIVHNENVVRDIEGAGIKKIKNISRIQGGSSLLIRAHGSSQKTIEKANNLELEVIDATCPMVKEIHKVVRDMDKKGYRIAVIGDYNHDEVQGIVGQIQRKAIVLENIADIEKKIPPNLKKLAVVVQSTQNLEKVLHMQDILKKRVPDLKFHNTICSPTRLKQNEIKTLPRKNDCIVVIGSKTSANTKRLYEIAKSINQNSYWVQSSADIKKNWFKGVESVGITAGASTPDETIQEVKEHIQKITA
ncbi:MAG: 4-hydroxy-3-methylbut-2-enyl diphosphate reductase [Candidatus Omnitrophota bacterium]